MQPVQQVRHDEVAELQKLLWHRGRQQAHGKRQRPEERAAVKQCVCKGPRSEHIPRNQEEAHKLMSLVDSPPHVEGEVSVVGQQVAVDVGEPPDEEQGAGGQGQVEQRPLPQRLQEAQRPPVAKRHRKWEEQCEGQEVEELGEVQAGLMAAPIAYNNAAVPHHEARKTCRHQEVWPRCYDDSREVGRGCDKLPQEARQPLGTSDAEGHMASGGGSRALVTFLGLLGWPGLVHRLCHHGACAKANPHHVGLAEQDGADAKRGRRCMGAVESHQVGEQYEEGGAGVCVVQKGEEVEHGEGGEGERRQDSPPGRAGLESKHTDRSVSLLQAVNTKYSNERGIQNQHTKAQKAKHVAYLVSEVEFTDYEIQEVQVTTVEDGVDEA